MARQATSQPGRDDPNYGNVNQGDPTIALSQNYSQNQQPLAQEQAEILRKFFKDHNYSHDDQVRVVRAIMDRTGVRISVSPQETLDLAKEVSYTDIEKNQEAIGQTAAPRPNAPGSAGSQAQAAKAPTPEPTPSVPDSQWAGRGDKSQGRLAPQTTDAQWAEATAILGVDNAKQQYADAKARYAQNSANLRSKGETVPDFATPDQWFTQQQQTLEGQWSYVIDQLGSTYASQHGVAMPAEVRQQLVSYLNNLPPSAQANLTAGITTANTPTTDANGKAIAVSQAVKNAQSLVGDYMSTLSGDIVEPYFTEHATTADLQKTAAKQLTTMQGDRIRAYIIAFGNRPLPADANTWANMTEVQWNDFLDKQPYKLGMNKKQYDAASSQISSAWQSAFGVPASDAVIAWAAGKSQEQVTQYINGQPSRVKGMNVGQYNGVVQSGDTISQNLWGHPMDDHLVSLLWGHLSDGNPRSTPAPPALQGTQPQIPDKSTLNPSTPTSPATGLPTAS